jgi:hypothetical protein
MLPVHYGIRVIWTQRIDHYCGARTGLVDPKKNENRRRKEDGEVEREDKICYKDV